MHADLKSHKELKHVWSLRQPQRTIQEAFIKLKKFKNVKMLEHVKLFDVNDMLDM